MKMEWKGYICVYDASPASLSGPVPSDLMRIETWLGHLES